MEDLKEQIKKELDTVGTMRLGIDDLNRTLGDSYRGVGLGDKLRLLCGENWIFKINLDDGEVFITKG